MTKEQLIKKSEYKAMALRLFSKLTYLRESEIHEAADFLTELRFMEDKEKAAKKCLEAMESGCLYPVYGGEWALGSCGKHIAQKLCDDIVDCRRIEDEKI